MIKRIALLCIVYASFTTMVDAQIFGSVYDVCDYPTTAVEARVIDATAMMVPLSLINSDNSGLTYNIIYYPLYSLWGNPVCSDDPHYGLETAGAGRTAVLIARNRMMTAPHSKSFDPSNYAVVFREKHGSNLPCTSWDWVNIPSDRVYFPKSTGGTNHYSFPRYDFATFELDRYVAGRKPIKIRRSGAPRLDDPLFVVGHPLWRATSVEGEGFLNGFTAAPHPEEGSGEYLEFHPLPGSSGSVIYNLKDEVIDTVIARIIDAGSQFNGVCTSFYHDTNPDRPGKRTNGPIMELESAIPRAEVKVAPIDDVLHIADIGAQLPQPVTEYVLTASLGSSQYEIMPIEGEVNGGPTLSGNIPPGYGVINLFDPLEYEVTASIDNVTSCGIWNMQINVKDAFHDQNNYLRHRFEIGMHEVEITPSDGWSVSALGSPFLQTKSYTLTNRRPTATSIVVNTYETASALKKGWLRVNGGYSETVALAPAGAPGDSDSVTLSISPTAAGYEPLSTSPAEIQFKYVDLNCAIDDTIIVKAASFTLGKQMFTTIDDSGGMLVPANGSPLGPPYILNIDLLGNPDRCVDDLDIDFGLFDPEQSGLIEEYADDIRITLVSPQSNSYVIWDRLSIPNSQYTDLESLSFGIDAIPVSMLYLDDESTTPTANLLSSFDGEEVDGLWELHVQLGPSSNFSIMPATVRLQVEASACE